MYGLVLIVVSFFKKGDSQKNLVSWKFRICRETRKLGLLNDRKFQKNGDLNMKINV